MSNLIHKFTEKVGGSLDDDNQERQHQKTQFQADAQGQSHAGMQGRYGMTQPRRFQTGENLEREEDTGRDQYDLGRTSGGTNDAYMGTGGMKHHGQHHQHQSQYGGQSYQSQMGDQDESTNAGRGFKDDWKTAENMRLAGHSPAERNM